MNLKHFLKDLYENNKEFSIKKENSTKITFIMGLNKFLQDFYKNKKDFSIKKKKSPIIEKILLYYGLSIFLITVLSMVLSLSFTSSVLVSFISKVLYLLFYPALVLKLFLTLDEIVSLRHFYLETGFTPFLMVQSAGTAVKVCAMCVAGVGAAASGYIYAAGEYSTAYDSQGLAYKHTPVRSMSDYAQGKIGYKALKHGILNPHEVAAGYARAADAARDAAKKAALEADLKNKRWF